MSPPNVLEWFRAATRRWPRVEWAFDRYCGHVGEESPNHPEDLFLGGAASERIEGAWTAIDSEFKAEVLRRVHRIGRDASSAEDLWSDAITRLLEEDPDAPTLPGGTRASRIRRFRGAVPMPAYIAVVAKRIGMDALRRVTVASEARRTLAGTTGRPEDPAVIASTAEQADRFAAQFVRALSSLTPTRQALLALVFGQGMGKAEAGRLLGLRDYQVSRELTSAMDSLRITLESANPGAWSPHAVEAWSKAWTALGTAGSEAIDERS